jgi:nucleotide-binding universal stress UspA family protein
MFTRVLVGYQETPQGREALTLGTMLAQASAAKVLVASVYPLDGFSSRWHPEQMDRAAKRLRRHLHSRISEAAAPSETRCLRAHSPAAGLRRLALAEGAGLIAVGSSHRGPLGRVLPGSVGERLIGGSRCAVAVAPRGYGHKTRLPDLQPRVIGVGYDGSREAGAALRAAADLAQRAEATLRVIAVGTPHQSGPAAAMPEAQGWAMKASYDLQDRLQEAVAGLPDKLRPQAIYLRGDPAGLIVEMAEQGIDLLVVGSRSSGFLPSFGGTICSRILRTAPCPVVAVPTAGEAADPAPALAAGAAVDLS